MHDINVDEECPCHGTGEIVIESCTMFPYDGLPQYRAVTKTIEKCPDHPTATTSRTA